MAHSLLKRRNYFLAGALIIAHLATCLLAPWFHQHADEDHAEIKGDLYHAHVAPDAAQASESERAPHDLPDASHLLEGAQLFENVHAAFAAPFGQIFNSAKFASPIDFFVSSFAENSPSNAVVKIVLKLPPLQPVRDYFALIAAGLSPPFA
jgi:hypothetical protein